MTVVLAHVYGEVFVGGALAVQVFYLISGFLIAHVLHTNPAYADPKRFYVNRLLRIYPGYIVVALATLLYAMIIEPSMLDIYRRIPLGAALFAGIANVTILGQDWVMFSGVSDGHLKFFVNFRESDPQLWRALLVPQAWTLGVELTFYAVAPYLVRRPTILWIALLLSCGVRACTWSLGLRMADPWTYRFFPSELALFLLGALSNRYVLPAWKRWLPDARQSTAVVTGTACLLSLCLGFGRIPIAEQVKTPLLFAACTALLPLAFMFQSTSRLDKWMGELSFPLYITHMLVIWAVGSALSALGASMGTRPKTLVVLAASFIAAIAVNRLVVVPTEHLRSRFRSGQGTSSPRSPTTELIEQD